MLEIRNVTKVYRSKTGEEVRALDNVSINFPEAGMVFILGKSGSGKSTLLNVMGGLDSYDNGEFIIKGKSSNDFVGSDFDAYRNTFIGFIFQEYNVLDDFTVGANIGLALELQGKKATEKKINEILSSVDLLNYAHRKPNELSGGQKQRVAIARALVKEPQIIMADEPTGALDSNTGKQIFDALKELSKTKLVLIVSHDRDFAERYADRIIEMADGRIIEDVTKHEHQAEKISEGVHRINDNILRIESGYKLTAADLDMINAYLAKAGGDVLLSGDGRVNDELRSAAGISKDGATTVFEGTDPQKDIKTKKYEKGETKFIRSKLPMKNAVKMGASGLKHKKFRLVMTILLSFISFAMFGLSSSMAAYEKVNAATQSIIDTEIRSAAMTMGVRRTSTYDDGEMYSWHESHAMNDADLAKLKELTGLDFLPVFTGYDRADSYSNSQNFDMEHVFKQYESNSVFSGRIAGLIDIDQEKLPAEYQLMAGNWRANKGEVVITEFFLRQLQQYGYTDGTTTIEGKDVTAEAIIGKTISIRNIGHSNLSESQVYTLTIVGVLNTNFNYDRYQNLMPSDDTHQVQGPEEDPSLLDMFLEKEVKYERDFGFHGMAFAHKDDIDAMTAMMGMNYGGSSLGEYMSGFNSNLLLSFYKAPEVDGDNPAPVNAWLQRVGSSSVLPQLDKITFEGAPKDTLAADEMLLSYKQLANSEFLPGAEMSLPAEKLSAFEAAVTPVVDASFAEYKMHNNVVQAAKLAYRDKYIADALAADPGLEAAVMQDANDMYGGSYWGTAADYWKERWGWDGADYAPAGAATHTYGDMKNAFASNTVIKNSLITLLGLPAGVSMSEYGLSQMLGLFEQFGAEISYNSMVDRYAGALLADYFVSQGYHIVNGSDPLPAFVNTYVNDCMEGRVSEWRGMGESERIERLTSQYRWDYTYNSSKFGGTRTALYEGAMAIYLSMTGQTMADVFTAVNSLLFKLESTSWDNSGNQVREEKTDYSEHKVIGFFITEMTEGDDMVVSDTIHAEYTAWVAEQEKVSFSGEVFVPNYTEERIEHTPGSYAFALAPISAGDADAIQKLVELTYSDVHTTDFLFEMQNAVMYTLGSFNEMIEILAQVFVWVGLGLALFSALLLMNFISTSISYKKRDIGILRAVGARSSDVFKIFFSEAFIIALINFLLAVATSVAAVMVLNYYMRNSGINITLLSFGALQIIIMLGVSILVAALASFLPVRSIARKKPVDAIKDR